MSAAQVVCSPLLLKLLSLSVAQVGPSELFGARSRFSGAFRLEANQTWSEIPAAQKTKRPLVFACCLLGDGANEHEPIM